MSRCPNGYFGNGADNQCIQSCTPLYADEVTNLCTGTCSVGSTADNNSYTCKSKCNYN